MPSPQLQDTSWQAFILHLRPMSTASTLAKHSTFARAYLKCGAQTSPDLFLDFSPHSPDLHPHTTRSLPSSHHHSAVLLYEQMPSTTKTTNKDTSPYPPDLPLYRSPKVGGVPHTWGCIFLFIDRLCTPLHPSERPSS